MSLLEITSLKVSYGAIPALRDVSLTVDARETLAVVGANGAGKSTLSLAISGVLAPVSGSILFKGQNITAMKPEQVAQRGISLIPEGRHIFEGLTVEENLLMGTTLTQKRGDPRARIAEVMDRFPILAERRSGMATRLSGGEQQQLAIARAMLTKPELLILDEPSLGLAPVMVDRVYETLTDLKAMGVAMLLIEQNPVRLGRVADRVAVMVNGSVAACGTPAEVLGGHDIERAYLGLSQEDRP